jgi:hypothetical protein
VQWHLPRWTPAPARPSAAPLSAPQIPRLRSHARAPPPHRRPPPHVTVAFAVTPQSQTHAPSSTPHLSHRRARHREPSTTTIEVCVPMFAGRRRSGSALLCFAAQRSRRGGRTAARTQGRSPSPSSPHPARASHPAPEPAGAPISPPGIPPASPPPPAMLRPLSPGAVMPAAAHALLPRDAPPPPLPSRCPAPPAPVAATHRRALR